MLLWIKIVLTLLVLVGGLLLVEKSLVAVASTRKLVLVLLGLGSQRGPLVVVLANLLLRLLV